MNVENSRPTISINDIISQYNEEASTSLDKFTVPKIAALIISKYEELIDLYENEQDEDRVSNLYYEKWMHSDKVVKLWDGTEAKIIDLDDFGFLRVLTKAGDLVSVHPDGNSYDMTRGLIVPKK